jgi:hypothetical protein
MHNVSFAVFGLVPILVLVVALILGVVLDAGMKRRGVSWVGRVVAVFGICFLSLVMVSVVYMLLWYSAFQHAVPATVTEVRPRAVVQQPEAASELAMEQSEWMEELVAQKAQAQRNLANEMQASVADSASAQQPVPTASASGAVAYEGVTVTETPAILHTDLTWVKLFIVGGILLFLIPGVIGISIWVKDQGASLSIKQAAQPVKSLLWLSPILAVLFLIGFRSLRSGWERQVIVPGVDTIAEPQGKVLSLIPVKVTSRAEETRQPVAAVPESTLSTSSLPSWVTQGIYQHGDKMLTVVSSQQFETVQEALNQALETAAKLVTFEFHVRHRGASGWSVPKNVIQSTAVQNRYDEQIERRLSTSDTPFQVHRVHLQVELSPRVYEAIRTVWQGETVDQRLNGLSVFGGLLTLVFGVAAVYLRLDDRTSGAYRGRLRFAAVALILGAGLVSAALIDMRLFNTQHVDEPSPHPSSKKQYQQVDRSRVDPAQRAVADGSENSVAGSATDHFRQPLQLLSCLNPT